MKPDAEKGAEIAVSLLLSTAWMLAAYGCGRGSSSASATRLDFSEPS